jgi:hypothetical protein
MSAAWDFWKRITSSSTASTHSRRDSPGSPCSEEEYCTGNGFAPALNRGLFCQVAACGTRLSRSVTPPVSGGHAFAPPDLLGRPAIRLVGCATPLCAGEAEAQPGFDHVLKCAPLRFSSSLVRQACCRPSVVPRVGCRTSYAWAWGPRGWGPAGSRGGRADTVNARSRRYYDSRPLAPPNKRGAMHGGRPNVGRAEKPRRAHPMGRCVRGVQGTAREMHSLSRPVASVVTGPEGVHG